MLTQKQVNTSACYLINKQARLQIYGIYSNLHVLLIQYANEFACRRVYVSTIYCVYYFTRQQITCQ